VQFAVLAGEGGFRAVSAGSLSEGWVFKGGKGCAFCCAGGGWEYRRWGKVHFVVLNRDGKKGGLVVEAWLCDAHAAAAAVRGCDGGVQVLVCRTTLRCCTTACMPTWPPQLLMESRWTARWGLGGGVTVRLRVQAWGQGTD